MPRGNCLVRDEFILRCGHPVDWTGIVQELTGDESALEFAFSALSISSVGGTNNDRRLVQQSAKVYGKALKDLQLALYSPSRMTTDETLTACMLLHLYETMHHSTHRGWISHSEGVAKLIELRGPERHNAREPHHVFLGSRLPLIYAGIFQCKSTFLAQLEWLSVPWTGHPRTYHDRMVDIMTRIPTVFEQIAAASIERDPAIAQRCRTEIVEQSLTLLTNLHAWKANVPTWSVNAKPSFLPEFIKYESSSDDPYPFDVQAWFQNHLFAQSFITYWGACLMLSHIINKWSPLAGLATSPADDTSSRLWRTENADPGKFATCIAQAIPYCLQPEMGAVGIIRVTFPFSLSWKYFEDHNAVVICQWLRQSFQSLIQRGIYIERFPNMLYDDDKIFPCDFSDEKIFMTATKGKSSSQVLGRATQEGAMSSESSLSDPTSPKSQDSSRSSNKSLGTGEQPKQRA